MMVSLRAGPLTLEFDPEIGAIRYVELPDGTEAVRAVYPSLRGADWSTTAPQVRHLVVQHGEDDFVVRFGLVYENGYEAEATITGGAADVVFAYEGHAAGAFDTNRTGLCVLHPASLADQPVEVRHPDGTRESGRFPDLVQPDWPFREIVGVSTKLPGYKVDVTMEGETFEMEDQRNFGDASFKTYCYPQSRPYPYRIEAGGRIAQTVRIKAQPWGSRVEGLPPMPEGVAGLLFIDETLPVPLLGLTVGPIASSEAIAAAPADFVSFRAEEARDLPKPMEVVMDVSPDADGRNETMLQRMAALTDPIERLVVPLSAAQHLQAMTLVAGEAPVVLAGAGFAELNRSGYPEADGYGFGWHPQAHLTDDRTLFENVECLPDLVATVAERTEGPIIVGPLQIAAGADPRRGTLLEAAWLVSALASLARSDADAATLMGLDELSQDGKPTPAFHVLSDLHEFADGELVVGVGTARRAAGFGLVLDESFRAIVANLTPAPLTLSLVAAGDGPHTVKVLDGRNLERAVTDPAAWRAEPGETLEPEDGVVQIELGPYGVARIDAEVDDLEEGNP